MAYFLSDQLVGYQPVSDTSTTQRHPLGMVAKGYDPVYGFGEFVYLKGVVGTVLGSWVTFNSLDGTTTLAIANAIGPIAIAMSANVANQYGWYQIDGLATTVCTTVSTVADNAVLYLTATGGQVDDSVVSGDFIYDAKAAALTTTNGTLLAEIHRPYVTDQTT